METRVFVALKIAHNNGIFTYTVQHHDKELFGRRVKVPFRNRLLTGVIIGNDTSEQAPSYPLKAVEEVMDDVPIITPEQFALMEFAAKYYFNDLGACVHLAVPKNEKAGKVRKKSFPHQEPNLPTLSPQQKAVADEIINNPPQGFLLEGITGSGKTQIYSTVAHHMLKQNKSVLCIVPEISLTPQLVDRFEKALAMKVVVLHSNVTPAQKREAIFTLLNHPAQVVIGARSAIFAPIKDLGLIVVDEEHDASLKQEESPRYHARDLALWRGKNEKASVILGSATPSLESIHNVRQQKLKHLTLTERFHHNSTLPTIEVIDLKERAEDVDFRTQDISKSAGSKMCILSRPLVRAIEETINNELQVLLFLNQRGYARFGVCYQCGTMVECPHCSVGLTYYQQRQALLCHQCDYLEQVRTTCRNCLADSVRFVGLGTERLYEEVRLLFPHLTVERLDRDVVQSQRRLEATLDAMHNRTAHILIGTQMIAKGHDFLHVGLVGVVCADIGLSLPDFRAGEKTFQLITQVAGRAGRGHYKGRAIIQTFNPLHPSIHFAKTYDAHGFVEQELMLRRRFSQPPYTRAVLIRTEHSDRGRAESALDQVAHKLKIIFSGQILGPAPSSIERINNRYRFQLLLLSDSSAHLHRALQQIGQDALMLKSFEREKIRFIIDVDPYNLA